MRIAWFRATTPDTSDPRDDSALLIGELRAAHIIDVITEADAHDFVWQHFVRPWDLCVYELDTSSAHEFVWAYLVNYPGLVMLRSTDLAHLRVPLLASRCVVTANGATADVLRACYPDARVRIGGLIGSAPLRIESDVSGAVAAASESVTFAVVDDRPGDAAMIDRAFQRARDAGTRF